MIPFVNDQKERYWLKRIRGVEHSRAYGEAANAGYADRVDELLRDEENIGRTQFEFVADHGLSPSDRLLDIGCGYLRGGQYFIDYLEPGNYVGMDISRKGIEAAQDYLDDQFLAENRPMLFRNRDLAFAEFVTDSFDKAIAASVFTHLRRDDIEECLANIGRVLKPGGTFFASYFDAGGDPPQSSTVFAYNTSTFEELADQYGYDLTVYPEPEYPHVHGQRMLAFTVGRLPRGGDAR